MVESLTYCEAFTKVKFDTFMAVQLYFSSVGLPGFEPLSSMIRFQEEMIFCLVITHGGSLWGCVLYIGQEVARYFLQAGIVMTPKTVITVIHHS